MTTYIKTSDGKFVENPQSKILTATVNALSAVASIPVAAKTTGPQASSYAGASAITAMGAIGSLITATGGSLPAGTDEVINQAAGAALAGISGNIPGAVLGGVSALAGLLAIYRTEQTRISDEQIQNAVASMPRDQLLSLLNPDAASVNQPTTGATSTSITGITSNSTG